MQVYILPTIRINDGQYRGKLSYTEVLRAICAGFTKNAEPKVCMRVSVDDSCRDGSVGQTTCAIRWAAICSIPSLPARPDAILFLVTGPSVRPALPVTRKSIQRLCIRGLGVLRHDMARPHISHEAHLASVTVAPNSLAF